MKKQWLFLCIWFSVASSMVASDSSGREDVASVDSAQAEAEYAALYPVHYAFRNYTTVEHRCAVIANTSVPTIDVPDLNGEVALSILVDDAMNGEDDAVAVAKALIVKGINVNSSDTRGLCRPPLVQAAAFGYFDLVKLFIGNTQMFDDEFFTRAHYPLANIDAQDSEGNTALHVAFSYHHPELGAYLQTLGARADIVNEYGFTAQDYIDHPEYREGGVALSDGESHSD